MKVLELSKKIESHYLIIVDSSSSMNKLTESTLSGLNEQIDTLKELSLEDNNQEYFLSIVSFSNIIKPIILNQKIEDVKNITNEYKCSGMTALYDAIGWSLSEVVNNMRSSQDVNNIQTGVCIIITDGEENASNKYSDVSIKKMIGELESDNWSFTFIGANIDSYKSSSNIGMSSKNVVSFANDFNSNSSVYSTISSSIRERDYKIRSYSKSSINTDALNKDLSDFTGNIDLTK